MSEAPDPLPPDVAALFEAERARPALGPEALDAIRARALPGLARAASASRLAFGLKSGLLGLVVGAVVGAVATERLRPPRVVRVVTREVIERPAPPAAPVPPAVTVDAGPGPVDAAAPPTVVGARARASAPDAGRADPSREQLYLQRARSALVRRDDLEALRALTQHRQLYPGGALGEEREALLVSTLARLGRVDEARVRALDFRRRWPESVFRGLTESALREVALSSP